MRERFEKLARKFEETGVNSISQNSHLHSWNKPVDQNHLVAVIRSFLLFLNEEEGSLDLPMNVIHQLRWLKNQARIYRLLIAKFEQDEVDAILVIFINFIAGSNHCHCSFCSSELR